MKKNTATGLFFQRVFIPLLVITFSVQGVAQISPGELTKAHAHLEGLTNCTKCHVLGDKVTNAKCLECHKEIKSRLDQRKGFHASAEVSGKECTSCHSDHHGRSFDIVRFDIKRFDHKTTGFELTGAHLKQECIACHKDEHIESAEIRKKENTYLGLKTDCVSCHKDIHQNTLPINCASCHTTEAFIPASLFDHTKTDFPLKGKHKEEDCKSCHEVTFVNGAIFQRFKDIPHNSCAACHTDAHEGAFGTKCKDCHTEESFALFIGKSTFNHAQTQFPLVGKHRNINCASCHKMDKEITADQIFQDFRNKDFGSCVTCHEDVHESKLGTNCKQCHTEESFQKRLNPELFQHKLTGYPLEGKHETVDCRKCHETKMTDPLPHQLCMDCHDDYHEGQFITPDYKTDCRDCHTVEGFTGSTYTLEKHNEGDFPLKGAHLATPCFACHLQKDKWFFRNIGETCIDCHTDVHEGFLSEKYYPQKSCDRCHITDQWAQVSFEHQLTGFELSGKHAQTACMDCHKDEATTVPSKTVRFIGLKQECITCHENIHGQQFELGGAIDCKRCHAYEAWKPSTFDHTTARFALDGAHKKVACKECHKAEVVEGRVTVQYRLEQFECIDCHK